MQPPVSALNPAEQRLLILYDHRQPVGDIRQLSQVMIYLAPIVT